MQNYSIALIDDDTFHISMMQKIISEYDKIHKVHFRISIFHSGQAYLQAIESHNFHITIIDWNLPDMNGTQVVHHIRHQQYETAIITTATRQDCVFDAYHPCVWAYMLKPVIFSDLEGIFNRILPVIYMQNRIPNPAHSYSFKQGSFTLSLPYSKILFFEKYRNRMVIYTTSDCYQTYTTVHHLLQVLDPQYFIQIHQGCLVNWEHVTAIHGHTITIGDYELNISSSHLKPVMYHAHHYPPGKTR